MQDCVVNFCNESKLNFVSMMTLSGREKSKAECVPSLVATDKSESMSMFTAMLLICLAMTSKHF